jgi:hypothetical protein
VTPAEDPPSTDPSGVDENPANPNSVGFVETRPVADATPVAKKASGFPIEEAARPITLPAMGSEIALEVRNHVDPFQSSFGLRGRFGITRQVQVGLSYGIGGFYDDGGGKTAFNAGKAISLDVTYALQSWLGIRVATPVYMDPFSLGVVLGPEIKFRFGNKFAIGGLGDLVAVKLHHFLPSVTSERMNEANAAAVAINRQTSDGEFSLLGYAVFQFKPHAALIARSGVIFPDFSQFDSVYPLLLTWQHSTSRRIDLVATTGFENLDDPSASFSLQLGAKLRL